MDKNIGQNKIDVHTNSSETPNKNSACIEGEIPDITKYIRTFRNFDCFDENGVFIE